MNYQEKYKISRESSQALLKHLSGCVLSIFNTDDGNGPTKWDVFSGTLVAIGERLFVCTASHCIDQGQSLTRYWILGDKPRYMSDGAPRVVAAHGSLGDNPDVGLLELDRASFAQFSSKVACTIDRIEVAGAGRNNRLVSLIGAPAQLVKPEKIGQAEGFKAMVISYCSHPLDPSDPTWAKVEPPADVNIDIVLDYPAGQDQTTRLDTNEKYALPEPGGMSGGGLWDQGFGTHDVWSPTHAFLFGIQSAWHEGKRYVRAVQIIHWLRLIHQHYPDLRTNLEARFPILKPQGN